VLLPADLADGKIAFVKDIATVRFLHVKLFFTVKFLKTFAKPSTKQDFGELIQ